MPDALTDVSNIQSLEYKFRKVTSQSPKYPASSLREPGRRSCWSTATGRNHVIVCEFRAPVLLGYVRILNKATSRVEVSVSMTAKDKDYEIIQKARNIAHNKEVILRTGFLPCLFTMGVPAGLADPFPVRAAAPGLIGRRGDPEMYKLLVETPVNDLFNPLLPAGPDRGRQCAGPTTRGYAPKGNEKDNVDPLDVEFRQIVRQLDAQKQRKAEIKLVGGLSTPVLSSVKGKRRRPLAIQG